MCAFPKCQKKGNEYFMELIYVFAVGCSLALLFAVVFNAAKNKSIAGSRAFIWQIFFVSIWSIGSMMEMICKSEQGMLFWRNFEQIGVFLIPVACVYFAVNYAQYDRFKKYLPILLIIPIIAIVLIFTDSWTHIMRIGYIVVDNPVFGKALSVRQTEIGKAFVAYNYILALISLVILYVYSRQISKNLRRQVIFILIGTACIFLFGLFKSAFLEGTRVNIPIVILYLPTGLIYYYNLYRNNLFRISPIARDKAFDVIEMGILVTDNSGVIVDVNPFSYKIFASILGIKDTLIGKNMNEFFGEYKQWLNLMEGNTFGEAEVKVVNEKYHFIHIMVHPLYSKRGTLVGFVSIIQDITERRIMEHALRKKAEMDGLTGLMNRDSFMEILEKRISDSILTGERITVLMIDLDKFKRINDTYGHDSGDRIIIEFADLLKQVLRHEDAPARMGGDEFAAVLPGMDRKKALDICNRILKIANSRDIQLNVGTSVSISASIGICDNEFIKSPEDMLKCADKAMYMAKKSNGNCCMAWEQKVSY